MKKTPRKTRIHLMVTDQDKPVLFGIVSTDPDYKLSLKLNKLLQFSLKKTSAVDLEESGGKKLHFSRFYGKWALNDTAIHLIANRSGQSFLLKSLVNVDFLLLFHEVGDKNEDLKLIPSKLREIDSITAVFTLDLSKMKEKNVKYIL